MRRRRLPQDLGLNAAPAWPLGKMAVAQAAADDFGDGWDGLIGPASPSDGEEEQDG